LKAPTSARELLKSRDLDIFSRPLLDNASPLEGGRTLLVLGGRQPDASWLRGFVGLNDPDVWAVDSGVASCRGIGRVPSRLIGDGDSSSQGDRMWAIEGGAREHMYDRDKDLTDFQIALGVFMGDSSKKIGDDGTLILSGCFGGRTDHLMSALFTFALSDGTGARENPRTPRVAQRCMIDDVEGILVVYPSAEASIKFHAPPGPVSLLPLSDRCAGVNAAGVKWPLEGATLYRSFPWTVSNEVRGDRVTVRCAEGVLAFCWRFGK
jgi:thiamine pyrophosphokinase